MSSVETTDNAGVDLPTHPEEMNATYELNVGRMISIRATARITPAGVLTTGIAIALVAFAFGYASTRGGRR